VITATGGPAQNMKGDHKVSTDIIAQGVNGKLSLRQVGPNQTELHIGDAVVFFSYETAVVAYIRGQWFRTAQKHSVTTSKHINQYLGSINAQSRDQEWFDHILADVQLCGGAEVR
jgi:hypothetical protein